MRIGIFTDLRFTALPNPTGVTKHIVQMVRGLYENSNNQVFLLSAKDQLDENGKVPENNQLSFLDVIILPHSWKFIYWQSIIANFFYYDKYTSNLDWVYCPKNDFLPLKSTKYAATIHGAHELDKDYPNPKGLIQFFLNYDQEFVINKL